MEQEFLLIVSLAHSGSRFVRHLLALHPSISRPLTQHELITTIEGGDDLLSDSGHPDAFLTDEFPNFLVAAGNAEHRYLQLNMYIHTEWLQPILWHRPFPLKMIITIRHPKRVLRSSYLRGESGNPVLARYATLLQVIRLWPDAFILPVDLLSEMLPDSRWQKMEDLVLNFLGLEIPSKLAVAIHNWTPLGVTAWDTRTLAPKEDALAIRHPFTEIQKTDMEQRLSRSNIYKLLNEVGIDYYHESDLCN